ncbi:MAG TPA: outer membrane lipoprotein carrier protein LolA [Gemmatimonadales bacterium]|nr:outer membrane lipoprotein carrier protein LolA [Gemmatimonadales bacterium]
MQIWMPALAVLALQAQPAEAQGNARDVVGRAARAYADLSSLRADFEQRIEDSLIGTFDSRGNLVQAGQNRLAMRFVDPAGDAIVIDGRQIWVYTPSTAPGQVIRMPLPSGPVYGFNVLSWILDKPAERYRMRYLRADRIGGRPVDVVELIPITAELPFSRALVWLDRQDHLPRRLEITERRGGTRTITLSQVRTNEAIAAETFAFDVPRGVRIVDQR